MVVVELVLQWRYLNSHRPRRYSIWYGMHDYVHALYFYVMLLVSPVFSAVFLALIKLSHPVPTSLTPLHPLMPALNLADVRSRAE